LFQWVEELDGLGEVEHMELVDKKGRRHHYRWVNQVPLNGTRDADQMSFFEYWLIVDQKANYHNSSKFSSRKEYWNILRGVIKIMLFRNFEHLLCNVADPPEIMAPG
jgi:hypothetical protein